MSLAPGASARAGLARVSGRCVLLGPRGREEGRPRLSPLSPAASAQASCKWGFHGGSGGPFPSGCWGWGPNGILRQRVF